MDLLFNAAGLYSEESDERRGRDIIGNSNSKSNDSNYGSNSNNNNSSSSSSSTKRFRDHSSNSSLSSNSGSEQQQQLLSSKSSSFDTTNAYSHPHRAPDRHVGHTLNKKEPHEPQNRSYSMPPHAISRGGGRVMGEIKNYKTYDGNNINQHLQRSGVDGGADDSRQSLFGKSSLVGTKDMDENDIDEKEEDEREDSGEDQDDDVFETFNQVSPNLREWCIREFFYASIDNEFYKDNEFVKCMNDLGLGRVTKTTRAEWNGIRCIMNREADARPRRVSQAFLKQELAKLNGFRRKIRAGRLSGNSSSNSNSNSSADVNKASEDDAAEDTSRIMVGERVNVVNIKTKSIRVGVVMDTRSRCSSNSNDSSNDSFEYLIQLRSDDNSSSSNSSSSGRMEWVSDLDVARGIGGSDGGNSKFMKRSTSSSSSNFHHHHHHHHHATNSNHPSRLLEVNINNGRGSNISNSLPTEMYLDSRRVNSDTRVKNGDIEGISAKRQSVRGVAVAGGGGGGKNQIHNQSGESNIKNLYEHSSQSDQSDKPNIQNDNQQKLFALGKCEEVLLAVWPKFYQIASETVEKSYDDIFSSNDHTIEKEECDNGVKAGVKVVGEVDINHPKKVENASSSSSSRSTQESISHIYPSTSALRISKGCLHVATCCIASLLIIQDGFFNDFCEPNILFLTLSMKICDAITNASGAVGNEVDGHLISSSLDPEYEAGSKSKQQYQEDIMKRLYLQFLRILDIADKTSEESK